MPDSRDTDSQDSSQVSNHLANDRTYLAWIRTGVSMMGLGVVIAKLKYIIGSNYPESSGVMHAAQIGLWFAVIGVLTILMSALFFLQTQREIRQGTYKARKLSVLILTALLGLLGIIILWYLMQQPSAPG